jgi:hypothetical protein
VVVQHGIGHNTHPAEPLVAPHILEKILFFLIAEDMAAVDNSGKAMIDRVGYRIRGMEAWERHSLRVFTKTDMSS